MLLADFLIRFPEFSQTDTAQVQANLDAAANETDLAIFGTLYDEAQALLAAHKLCISPFGQNTRLVAKDGTTTYGKERARIVRLATCGAGRVA